MHWSITGKCNFNCHHCLVSTPNAHHPQLPLEDSLRATANYLAGLGVHAVADAAIKKNCPEREKEKEE